MYAFSAPLGTIILRVPQNILSEPRIFGGLFPLNTILVKFLQPVKNHTLKFVKELEIVILVNLSQSAKASFPMLVTELGILILFKLLQPEKASSPMLVTELEIFTLVRLIQP